MSKKLEEKRERRLAEERRRAEIRKAAARRNWTTVAVALVVAALVVFLIVRQRTEQTEASNDPIGVAASAAGCGEVESAEDQGGQHITSGEPHEPYNSNPPTSGPHIGSPPGADAAFYAEPIEPELVVHNLEHGQIVIWYKPDLADTTLDQIREYVERENEEPTGQVPPLLAVPYDDIDEGNYVVTAWTQSQSCDQFSSLAVDDFRADHQNKTEEPLAGPFEG